MKTVAEFVVKHRVFIALAAVIIFIVSLFGYTNLRVNYDIFSYLPDDVKSVRGMKILNEKFKLGSIIQVALENVPDSEVNVIVNKIGKIEEVEDVDWITSFSDITVPKDFLNEELVSNYYSDNATLIRVSFKGGSTSPKTEKAYKEVLEILKPYESYVSGTLATNTDLQKVINSDMVKYFLAAIILVTIVLLLTLPSIMVPFLFVLTIGFAAIVNLGLSYFLGQEISYFTRVIVLPLQFAVTMDYALFLYHRYEEESRNFNKEKAMVEAISSTFKSISTASITTIAGFLSLGVMRIGFGPDIGFTLARGVLITLISIITLLPALFLIFDKAIHKISHKIFIPKFETVGKYINKYAGVITTVFFVLLAFGLYANSLVKLSFNFEAGMPEDLPSMEAERYMSKKFGQEESAFIVFNSTNFTEIDNTLKKIKNVNEVTRIFGYTELVDPLIPKEFVSEDIKSEFIKDSINYYMVDFKYSSENQKTVQAINSIKNILADGSVNSYLTGETPMLEDFKTITREDTGRVNFYSLLAIFIILVIAYRSITVPLLVTGSIELAILINKGLYGLQGTELVFIAAMAIGAIQLGSTVDYAVLMTSRYEEELKKEKDRKLAIKKAVGEASRPILTSAATMFSATIGMAVMSSIGTVKALGVLISRGAVISFFVVILLLPALLVLFQPLLKKTSINWPGEGK